MDLVTYIDACLLESMERRLNRWKKSSSVPTWDETQQTTAHVNATSRQKSSSIDEEYSFHFRVS
jgi:hypothetical protein